MTKTKTINCEGCGKEVPVADAIPGILISPEHHGLYCAECDARVCPVCGNATVTTHPDGSKLRQAALS